MTTTTTTATSCTICTLCRRLWDVEALAPADWDAVTEVASEHGNTDTGTTAASVLATCSSCLGILQKPSLPHEVVRTIAAGIQQRGYDARTFKLEFMTKEFEGIRRPIERTAGGKFPSLVKIKDSFRQRVKDRFGGDPVLQNLEWRTSSDNGALLISIHLVDLAQSARANDADCTNPKKRTRRQQRQKNNGGGRTLGNASQVQNSSQEQIPSDHQTYCLAVSKAISVKVRVFREPVFVYGRYIKCSRRISQTPWVINGSRKGVSSVEEALAGPILDKFKPTTYKFHSAGREDYNVRMCGNGRPFIFELIDSTKGHLLGDEYKNLELAMNSREQSLVRVNSLREATSEFQQLKDGAETKRKSYSCVVWVSRALSGQQDLDCLHAFEDMEVQQETPLRVAHRRSLMVRPKVIHSMRAKFVNPHFFVLDLVAAAGTYIKEFVHGDRGRTKPSVGTLLSCRADILQLDVNHLIDDIGKADATQADP